jgi:hypothetical protein
VSKIPGGSREEDRERRDGRTRKASALSPTLALDEDEPWLHCEASGAQRLFTGREPRDMFDIVGRMMRREVDPPGSLHAGCSCTASDGEVDDVPAPEKFAASRATSRFTQLERRDAAARDDLTRLPPGTLP